MSRKIAIITARGGSKRIPRKNIRDFCGKPIIAYAIQTALQCEVFDKVMVSTDDKEIAEIAVEYGAEVPFLRSEKNAGDYATTEDVIMEVLDIYARQGERFEYACCLYPTAPFVTSELLKKAVNMMEEKKPTIVIPLVPFSYPPQRCFVIEEDGMAKYKYPQYTTTRSQDLEVYYHDVGQFYIYHVEKLFKCNGIIEDNFLPIVINEIQAQDIDNEEDWKMAELKYKYINGI